MYNKVTLIGNLGKDPDMRRLENGTPVANFSLATTESYKDTNGEWKDATEWHNIVVWRGSAEYAEKHLKRGCKAFIEGKITTRKYTDNNGIEKYTTEIVASICKSLEKKESNGGQAGTSTPSVSAPKDEPFKTPITNFDTEVKAGQKYRDRDGVVLTIISVSPNVIEFQSTKVSGLHEITCDNWAKSIATKYTLQDALSSEVEPNSDLPF